MPPRTRAVPVSEIDLTAKGAPAARSRRVSQAANPGGYDEGYSTGLAEGSAAGLAEGDATGYDRGVKEGDATGYSDGYDVGYAEGQAAVAGRATRANTEVVDAGAADETPVAGPQGNLRGLHGAHHVAANMGRAGLAEVIGTAILVYAGTATAGAAALGKSIAGSPPNSLAVALAFGLVLAALAGALGPVSGAHLNPAVTLGLAVTRKFPWAYVPIYMAAQLGGAILGALATWATLGNAARDKAHLGATYPSAGVGDGRAIVVEALITFLLVFVIIAVATDKRVAPAVASTSIGFALVAAVLIGGAITGGAVNPVRALGPMIVSLDFTSFWVYLVGPIVGGVVAAVLYDRVLGKGDAPTVAA